MLSSTSRSSSGDGGIVSIDLTQHPYNAPLGMLLAPGAGGGAAAAASSESSATAATNNNRSSSSIQPTMSNVILVAGWEHDGRLRRGNNSSSAKNQQQQRLGPIQRSGSVRLGDRLVRINNVDVTNWTFREVMDALKELVSTSSAGRNESNNYNQSVRNNKKVKLKSLGFAQVGTFEYWKNVHYTNNNHTQSPLMMITQQQQPSSSSVFYNLVNSDIQNNPYLQAAVEQQQLEIIQHRRRYKFMSYIGQWKVFIENINNDTNNVVHVVKYEIKCHILFTNPPSTLTSSNNNHITNNNNDSSSNNNNSSILRSWSVYKRYSELRTLDKELRVLFGWQMTNYDANNTGGIIFPSKHELETYWYKGTTALVTGSSGGMGRMVQKIGSLLSLPTIICKKTLSESSSSEQHQHGVVATGTTPAQECDILDDTDDPECADNANNSDIHNSPCPIPTSFINRRQCELTTYWSELMCIEDIFDFSNIQFGLLMTNFLHVDEEILRLIRGGRGGGAAATTSSSAASVAATSTNNTNKMMLLKPRTSLFPAINEDEESSAMDINIETTTSPEEEDNVPRPLSSSVPYYATTTYQQEEETSVGLISSLTFTREQSGGSIMIDDDVSALSDGTGAAAIYKKSDVDDNLSRSTLDIAPALVAPQTQQQHDDDIALVAVVMEEEEGDNARLSSSTSVTSSSVRSRGSSNSKRNVGIQPPRAKPAFQRQFL